LKCTGYQRFRGEGSHCNLFTICRTRRNQHHLFAIRGGSENRRNSVVINRVEDRFEFWCIDQLLPETLPPAGGQERASLFEEGGPIVEIPHQ
jgi:hypothetical protein